MSNNSIGLHRLGLQPRRLARSFEILSQNTLGRWPEAVREICVRVGTVLNGRIIRGLTRAGSRGWPVVVLQQATQTITTRDGSVPAMCDRARDELILEALMVPFAVIVRDELADRPA